MSWSGRRPYLCYRLARTAADPDVPDLKCYPISGHRGKLVNLNTEFGFESHVAVGQALELCLPASMAIPAGATAPTSRNAALRVLQHHGGRSRCDRAARDAIRD